MTLPRRKFIVGATAVLLAAPAIVRYASLMRVKPVEWINSDAEMLNLMNRAIMRAADLIANPVLVVTHDGICKKLPIPQAHLSKLIEHRDKFALKIGALPLFTDWEGVT